MFPKAVLANRAVGGDRRREAESSALVHRSCWWGMKLVQVLVCFLTIPETDLHSNRGRTVVLGPARLPTARRLRDVCGRRRELPLSVQVPHEHRHARPFHCAGETRARTIVCSWFANNYILLVKFRDSCVEVRATWTRCLSPSTSTWRAHPSVPSSKCTTDARRTCPPTSLTSRRSTPQAPVGRGFAFKFLSKPPDIFLSFEVASFFQSSSRWSRCWTPMRSSSFCDHPTSTLTCNPIRVRIKYCTCIYDFRCFTIRMHAVHYVNFLLFVIRVWQGEYFSVPWVNSSSVTSLFCTVTMSYCTLLCMTMSVLS